MSSNKKSSKEKNNRRNDKSTGGSWSSKARGDEEALRTNVFDYGRQEKMNQYNKTLEAIISHVGRSYNQPGNLISSLRELKKGYSNSTNGT